MKPVLILVAAIGTGLTAGTFLAFSNFVMAALARLPAADGVAAMQAINITVITPLFMTVLFGSGVLAMYLGFEAWRHWGEPGSTLILVASLCYIIGTMLVTMALNVPLNEKLAVMQSTSPEAQGFWNLYLDRWTMWNHVRGIAAVLASALYIWSLRLLQS